MPLRPALVTFSEVSPVGILSGLHSSWSLDSASSANHCPLFRESPWTALAKVPLGTGGRIGTHRVPLEEGLFWTERNGGCGQVDLPWLWAQRVLSLQSCFFVTSYVTPGEWPNLSEPHQ